MADALVTAAAGLGGALIGAFVSLLGLFWRMGRATAKGGDNNAIDSRITPSTSELDRRIDRLEEQMNGRFDRLQQQIDHQHKKVMRLVVAFADAEGIDIRDRGGPDNDDIVLPDD